MKIRLLILVLSFLNNNLFAQCHDSVQISVGSYNDASLGFEFTSRIVTHFTFSGNKSSAVSYMYNSGIWLATNKNLYFYDQYDSLIRRTYQLPVDTGWINSSQILYTYSASGKLTNTVYQNWDGSSWNDYTHEYYFYDTSDSLINSWTENFYSGYWHNQNQSFYYYDNFHQDTLEILQLGDSNAWMNQTRYHYTYNLSGLKIYQLMDKWINNAWEPYQQIFYTYTGSLLNSELIQLMDTVWKNNRMHNYTYSPFGQVIRDSVLQWADTLWMTYELIITDVDQYGYPSFFDDLYYHCPTPVTCYWESITGFTNFYYDSTGHFMGSNDGSSSASFFYDNNWILIREYRAGTHMGGNTYESNTDYYYNEIYGNAHICNGSNTVLSVDSCPGYTYLWNTGATTSSIIADTAGTYSIVVTYPNGFQTYTEPFTLCIDSFPPHFTFAPDSVTNICSNRTLVLNDISSPAIHYQWYRNDTALAGKNNYIIYLSEPGLIAGTYYLVKYNACGGDTSAKTTVNLLPVPDASITALGPLTFCSGGSVTLSAPAGYSYHWGNGATTQQTVSTTFGWNTVTVINSSGCSNTGSVLVNSISYPATPQIIQTSSYLHCTTNATFYQWLLNGDTIFGATSVNFTHLVPGNYSVICANDTLCPVYSNSQFFNLCSVSLHSSDSVLCAGNCTVTISALSNGYSPYSFIWSTLDTASALSNLCAGTYWVTITDSQSCAASDTLTIGTDSVSIQSIALFHPTCSGCGDGSIIVNAINVVPPYHLLWTPQLGIRTGFEIDYLFAGQYQVCIVDGNGCMDCDSVTLLDPGASISTYAIENKLTIYPNPVHNFLELKLPDNIKENPFTVNIYDELGQEVLQESVFKKIINVKSLEEGLYLIKIIYGENIYSGFFVKE